jgi:transposase
MRRIAKARYTEEFKVAAVQLIDAGRRPAEMSREVGVVEQTLHNWLKARREGGHGHGEGVKVTPEQRC